MLKEFGLSKNEALIYMYLLGRGMEVGGSKIAFGTSIHRQYVYTGIKRLIELGLVEVVKHGKQSKYKCRRSEPDRKNCKKKGRGRRRNSARTEHFFPRGA